MSGCFYFRSTESANLMRWLTYVVQKIFAPIVAYQQFHHYPKLRSCQFQEHPDIARRKHHRFLCPNKTEMFLKKVYSIVAFLLANRYLKLVFSKLTEIMEPIGVNFMLFSQVYWIHYFLQYHAQTRKTQDSTLFVIIVSFERDICICTPKLL